MLQLDDKWPQGDDVPWCSAFVNYICWLLGVQRTRNLGARSWLDAGLPVSFNDATVGMDVIVLSRGGGLQPGVDVKDAAGHVGFFGGFTADKQRVLVLGGNQGDSVSLTSFPAEQILAIRRLSVVTT